MHLNEANDDKPAAQATAPNTVGITGFFTDPGFDFVTGS
jgi:hypothetical protein